MTFESDSRVRPEDAPEASGIGAQTLSRSSGHSVRAAPRRTSTETGRVRGFTAADAGPDVAVVRAYVDAIAAVTRSRAATDALEAALLADLVKLSGVSGGSSDGDLGLRSLAAEVGAAVRVSDRTIQHQMSDAFQLVNGFPAVHAALSEGQITTRHVRVILEHGVPIEPGPARDEYVQRALPLARLSLRIG